MDEPRLRACIEANGLDDWADQIVGVAAPCILLRAARDKSNSSGNRLKQAGRRTRPVAGHKLAVA